MSDAAILVEGLGKRFRLKHQQSMPYSTLRGELASLAGRFTKGKGARPQARSSEDFWALRDVNLEISRGAVVGVIGRNGAGKSTLLKLVSRIIEPTEGRIRLRGRVASLLEVGTGFHPELTGRENVYLNGAILGMTKLEIRSRFDEIVDFAEVERFLDTPVKHYSSGMYMRLAFAVAAHLEPEVLLVDEVLAVGDAGFQAKCVGKMKTVAEAGRTILFVSHNMQAIQSLCTHGLLMAGGRVSMYSGVNECLQEYSAGGSYGAQSWARGGNRPAQALEILDVSCRVCGEQPNLRLSIDVGVVSRSGHKPAFVAVDIGTVTGAVLMQAIPSLRGLISSDTARRRVFRIAIDLPPMIPGTYTVGVWLGSHFTEPLDEAPQCISFEVSSSPTLGRTFPHHSNHGHIVPIATVTEHQVVES